MGRLLIRRVALVTTVLLITVFSVLKAPALPINDPAFFEYYGRTMLEGGKLYSDFTDVKLPSIFVVNMAWQALFGEHYFFHTYAEAIINLATIALFAILMHGFRVRMWEAGTLLFALVYSLVFPQFDYAQHYAVALILLGLILAVRTHRAIGGAMIALAATFWAPAILTIVPIVLYNTAWTERRATLLGAAGMGVVYYTAFIPALGAGWPFDPLMRWPANFAGPNVQYDLAELRVTALQSALGPAVGALVACLAATVRRPSDKVERFALWWLAAAAAGTALPPRFTEHFFLPSLPALCMAVATYGLPSLAKLRGLLAFAFASVCVFVSVRTDVANARSNDFRAAFTQDAGSWIIANIGVHRVMWTEEFVPELYLTAHAILPEPASLIEPYDALASGSMRETVNGKTSDTPVQVLFQTWKHWPDLIVYGPVRRPDNPVRSLTIVTRDAQYRASYALVCGGVLFSRLAFYAPPELARRFTCPD